MISTRSYARAFGRTAHRAAILAAGPIALSALPIALPTTGCDYVDAPYTYVVVDNNYPTSASTPLVVYEAYWQAVAFTSDAGTAPIPPGSSSPPQSTVPASENTAWAVLAPGWDPSSSTPPTSFVVLQSRSGFAVDLNNTVHIPVDDADFAGNCAAGSALSQSDANFITRLVFPSIFQGLRYEAATCTTTHAVDAGSP